MESGGQLFDPAEQLDRKGGLLEDDGFEHEASIFAVCFPEQNGVRTSILTQTSKGTLKRFQRTPG
jgi:hypothetical protein